MRRIGPALLLFLVAALTNAGFGGGTRVRGEDDPPSLPRAQYLEKTMRDPEKALVVFEAVAAAPATSAADRAQARFGAARCHESAGRFDAAIVALSALVDDEGSPTTDREDARIRRDALVKAKTASADRDAEARRNDEMRRAEDARLRQEDRLVAARSLIETAVAHIKARRYEDARQCLIDALERDTGNERAKALLEEVGGRTDRGELLKQAIRFVASNRVVDLSRLTSTVDALRRSAKTALTEGRPGDAVDALRTAVTRIDESDFYGELEGTRRELVVWFAQALKEAKAKGDRIADGTSVPAARPTPDAAGPVKPWRTEFFSLLGRIFASREDGTAAVRFYDEAIPPDASPETQGTRFSGSGISSSTEAGTLRRSRWLERHLRREVAPGSWSGVDRLLDRYEDLVVVQHGPGVLKTVDALAASFPAVPAPPLSVEIRVYGATTEGLKDAARLLGATALATEEGVSAVVRTHSLEEQETLLGSSTNLVSLARASLRLGGRRTATIRFHEPTTSCPAYAEKTAPPVVVPDRDATYGLDVELYGEDLAAGGKKDAAMSIVARVRRPDRPRLAPLASGWVMTPVFVEQASEADRRLPYGASIVMFGLSNPFRATGYAGDAAGGSHPDLLVLVSARPSDRVATPDVAPPVVLQPTNPTTPTALNEISTRDYDLGAVGHDVSDEPPPEEWPRTTFAAARGPAGRGSRDAFLAGWISDQTRLARDEGPVLVHDGKATATASIGTHGRIGAVIEALLLPADRVVRVEVTTVEVAAGRAKRLLSEVKAGATSPEQRVYRLDAAVTTALAEKLALEHDPASPYEFSAHLAARHTQLVTGRAIRSRAIIEEIHAERRDDGTTVLTPVNGTVEEGAVVSVRPVVWTAGLVSIYATALLADVEKIDEWRPDGLPSTSPLVSLPRHRVERAAAVGALGEGESLLLLVPSPGSNGARVVLVTVRLPQGP